VVTLRKNTAITTIILLLHIHSMHLENTVTTDVRFVFVPAFTVRHSLDVRNMMIGKRVIVAMNAWTRQ